MARRGGVHTSSNYRINTSFGQPGPVPMKVRSIIQASDGAHASERDTQREHTSAGSTGSPRSLSAIASGAAVRTAPCCTQMRSPA